MNTMKGEHSYKKNWAEKLKRAIDRYPLVILIVIATSFISYAFTLGSGIFALKDFFDSRIGWRKVEERRINRLFAGMSVDKFKEILDSPMFVTVKENLTEYSFKERGYWVQAIVNEEGEVKFYSVTSCSDSFHPEIKYNPAGGRVKLGLSTFKSVTDYDPILKYFISGATANTNIMEYLYLGNPGNYQTVYWGINDACSYDDKFVNELLEVKFREGNNSYDIQDKTVDSFRKNTKINTFGVSAPFFDPLFYDENPLGDFQIGVDRIKVRTHQN
jgi:hypothetical protein